MKYKSHVFSHLYFSDLIYRYMIHFMYISHHRSGDCLRKQRKLMRVSSKGRLADGLCSTDNLHLYVAYYVYSESAQGKEIKK